MRLQARSEAQSEYLKYAMNLYSMICHHVFSKGEQDIDKVSVAAAFDPFLVIVSSVICVCCLLCSVIASQLHATAKTHKHTHMHSDIDTYSHIYTNESENYPCDLGSTLPHVCLFSFHSVTCFTENANKSALHYSYRY